MQQGGSISVFTYFVKTELVAGLPNDGQTKLDAEYGNFMEYLGSSAANANRNCKFNAPVPRHWQHIMDAASATSQNGTRKTRLLRKEVAGNIGQIVLASGPDLTIRAMERAGIQAWRWQANGTVGTASIRSIREHARSRRGRPFPRFRNPMPSEQRDRIANWAQDIPRHQDDLLQEERQRALNRNTPALQTRLGGKPVPQQPTCCRRMVCISSSC